jgi:outer membrane lipoprotein carrier protein
VRRIVYIALLAASACWAETKLDPKLDALLKNVESHYNPIKTLQVLFREEYTKAHEAKRIETGLLMLRKPGRMRWDYSEPKGKLFISDGKELWIYNAAQKRAENTKIRESEDMRAPLAFLLGKLNFQKEFQNIQSKPEGNATRITADPRSDNLPYSKAEFLVTDAGVIIEVRVTSFDNSVLRFTFEQEKVNPPLDNKLFQFAPPPGTEVIKAQ